MTVATELNQLIALLEAEIPANPNSSANLRLRISLQRELAKYFKALSDAFPYDRIDEIYNQYVKESLGSETGDLLNPLLATFDDTLTTRIDGQLVKIYSQGQAEMITWGKTKAGIPIAYEGPPVQGAIDWATKHISKVKLVDGINAETKNQISNIIADGIRNKRGIPGIQSDIRHKFNWMARGTPSEIRPGLTLKSRAEMIARTETSEALSQASLDTMKDMGIDGKEWVTSGDDRVSDECLANEADKVIPVNQAFTSGAMAPPQHPSCRCSLAPSILSK